MTKKDYIALAKLIKEKTDRLDGKDRIDDWWIHYAPFMNGLCGVLKSDNPNFNESKFREACGE